MSVYAPYKAEHANPQGPGDARPTALQMIERYNLSDKLRGKVMLVTGCSSGIGPETARALHATGADVYITVRKVDLGRKVAESIRAAGGHGKIEVLHMEMDSLAAVRKAADEFLHMTAGQCNILVNNAGIMACPEGKTSDGFETQFGVNHLAHFLLFQLLKSALLSSTSLDFPSRVICLSSSGHRNGPIQFDDLKFDKRGYTPFGAYGQSKLANVYMANEIEQRYSKRNLHAFSVMPGGIATPLQKHMDQKWLEGMKRNQEAVLGSKSAAQGAATSVMAALSPDLLSLGFGGKYLEDCAVSLPRREGQAGYAGYAPYAYDEAAGRRLWTESLDMVGLTENG